MLVNRCQIKDVKPILQIFLVTLQFFFQTTEKFKSNDFLPKVFCQKQSIFNTPKTAVDRIVSIMVAIRPNQKVKTKTVFNQKNKNVVYFKVGIETIFRQQLRKPHLIPKLINQIENLA